MRTIEPAENVLRDLYEGKLDYIDGEYEKGSAYSDQFEAFCQSEKELFQCVGEQNKEKAEGLVSELLRLESLIECERFIEGFKLGTRVILASVFDIGAKSIYKK